MGERLLAGVSGGPDSTNLRVFLNQSAEIGGQDFGSIICNHGWQNSNFILSEEIARTSFVEKKNFHYIASTHCLMNEQAASRWRQRAFRRLAKLKNYSRVVLGHTITDWVETCLIYLLRGGLIKNLEAVSRGLAKTPSNNLNLEKNYFSNQFW